jgi:TPR repeat protein
MRTSVTVEDGIAPVEVDSPSELELALARAHSNALAAKMLNVIDLEAENENVLSLVGFGRARYAYAQWVHGLNLLNGTGIPADVELGLQFIRKAADGKFEGAIKFVADAYAQGRYDFPRDEALAQQWLAKLDSAEIIGY